MWVYLKKRFSLIFEIKNNVIFFAIYGTNIND